jgi:hypothetical protein
VKDFMTLDSLAENLVEKLKNNSEVIWTDKGQDCKGIMYFSAIC